MIATLAALVLIAWVGFKDYARTDSFHDAMRAVVSCGMGMPVCPDGPLDIGLFPSPNVTLDDVTLALEDAKGCVIIQDQLGGSIGKPKIQNPGMIKTLAGPVRYIVNKW